MPRIIVKSGYIKGTAHREYYISYIATRDGVEKYKSDGGNKSCTKKQKEMITQILNDFPSSREMFEYTDYTENPSRKKASEFISAVIDQNMNIIATKENYVDYISNRPGVEMLGKHGLFTDEGVEFQLKDVVEHTGRHAGNVWTHIISIKREDASRLGYEDVNSWMNLCRQKRNELADALKIDPHHLRWYAAFHNEGHHPHIHMIVFSDDPREGYLTKNGIDKIRRMYASEIFRNDLLHLYQEQTDIRNRIKEYSQDIVDRMLQELDADHIENRIIFEKIRKLRASLSGYMGRVAYAYVPKESKKMVDEIVNEIEKDERIKNLYAHWQCYKENIRSTYSDDMMMRIPLSVNKEFRSVKNIILKEIMIPDEDRSILLEAGINEDVIEKADTDYLFYRLVKQILNNNECLNDRNKVIDYLEKSVALGNDYAKVTLAKIYLNNDDFENMPRAFQWLEECQNQYAGFLLGREYYQGNHVEKDLSKAIGYLSPYPESRYGCYLLSKIYEEKGDDDLSLHYLKLSCIKNYDPALIKMAAILINGTKLHKDVEKAIEYLEEAESRNNQFAQYMLGRLFLFGKDVKQDRKRAADYLERSANQGNIYARYLLEHMDDYQDQQLALMTARIFHHITNIFRNTLPNDHDPLHCVESKLKQKIRQKKIAIGHNRDDHMLG